VADKSRLGKMAVDEIRRARFFMFPRWQMASKRQASRFYGNWIKTKHISLRTGDHRVPDSKHVKFNREHGDIMTESSSSNRCVYLFLRNAPDRPDQTADHRRFFLAQAAS